MTVCEMPGGVATTTSAPIADMTYCTDATAINTNSVDTTMHSLAGNCKIVQLYFSRLVQVGFIIMHRQVAA